MPRFERLDFNTSFFSGSFVALDLNNTGKLNIKEFDQAACDLTFPNDRISQSTGVYGLKQIVIGDILYAFRVGPPDFLQHDNALEILRSLGFNGPLQSAGKVSTISDDPIGRAIHDWSFSLDHAGLLTSSFSDHYKMTIIKPALGEYFKVW